MLPGTDFHIDPEVTDAYNALIYGKKWWVYLPKDYLDYEENLACDPSCSSPMVNHTTVGGVWNTHILPQIRYKNRKKTQSDALSNFDLLLLSGIENSMVTKFTRDFKSTERRFSCPIGYTIPFLTWLRRLQSVTTTCMTQAWKKWLGVR